MPQVSNLSEVSMKPFKETFCEFFKCSPKAFLWELLKRSLYPRARPFARLIYLARPTELFDLFERAGETRNGAELREAIHDYEFNTSFLRKTWTRRFRMRVSCRRLLDLYAVVTKKSPS